MKESLGFVDAAKKAGHSIGFDRPTGYATLASLTPLVLGPVTALLVATRFSPQVQGYYYTFGSLTGTLSILEVGLGQAIVQLASHEWAALRWSVGDRVVGEAVALARLTDLGRQSVKWYGALAVMALFAVGPAGGLLFASDGGTHWFWPWTASCLTMAAALLVLPVFSLLQGCGRVADFWLYRWIQQIVNPITLWAAIGAGAGLWTPAIAAAVGICWSIGFLLWRSQGLLEMISRRPLVRSSMSWRADVWPLQWRVAMAWASVNLTMQMLVPVLFYFSGPVIAGRMGLTVTLANVVTAVASAWIVTKGPGLGVLAAQRKYQELDELFYRGLRRCVAAGVGGAAVVWTGVLALGWLELPLRARILSPLPAALLLAASIPNSVILGVSTYFRAYRAEPLAPMLLSGSGVVIALAVLVGARWGATGIVGSYLAVLVVYELPAMAVILRRCRPECQRPPAATVKASAGRVS